MTSKPHPLIAPLRHKREALFTVHEPADAHGRHMFTMEWWDDNYHTGPQRRAQTYRSELSVRVAAMQSAGYDVRVQNERGVHVQFVDQ